MISKFKEVPPFDPLTLYSYKIDKNDEQSFVQNDYMDKYFA